MAATLALDAYREVLIVLGTAGVAVPLMHRLKISPVIGFLGAGILVGPYGLGQLFSGVPGLSAITIGQSEEIAHVAEIGVVFLLFVIGLELSLERLWTMRRLVFGFGLAQVALSTAALALALHGLGLKPKPALAIGAALALSSTAIVVEVLSRMKRLTTATGRASFAVLLFQDLAVVPILFLVTVLGAEPKGSVAGELAFALLQSAAVLIAIVAVGRLALRPLFRLAVTAESPELFMAATLLVVLGTGVATAAAGLSMALGAFVAGLLLAETEYRREVAVTMEPFKGLLLGVFFLSVGMGIDLRVILREPLLVLGGAAALVLLKGLIAYGLALGFRLPRRVAFESALLLAPCGEFAFVVIGMGAGVGLIVPQVAAPVLAIVSLTMVLIPLFGRLGARLSPALPQSDPQLAALAAILPPDDHAARALIVGFGRVGQLVAGMLEAQNIAYLATDTNGNNVAQAREAGKPVFYGDSSRAEFLRRSGLMEARALIVTVGSSRAAEAIVAAARSLRPDIVVVARARDDRHAAELYRLGVTVAVPETIEASLQLSEAALVGLGVPMGFAIAATHEKRDEFRKDLQSRYATGPQDG